MFSRNLAPGVDLQPHPPRNRSTDVFDVGQLVKRLRRGAKEPGQTVSAVAGRGLLRRGRHLLARRHSNQAEPLHPQTLRGPPPDPQSRLGQPQHGRRLVGPHQQQSLRRPGLQVRQLLHHRAAAEVRRQRRDAVLQQLRLPLIGAANDGELRRGELLSTRTRVPPEQRGQSACLLDPVRHRAQPGVPAGVARLQPEAELAAAERRERFEPVAERPLPAGRSAGRVFQILLLR